MNQNPVDELHGRMLYVLISSLILVSIAYCMLRSPATRAFCVRLLRNAPPSRPVHIHNVASLRQSHARDSRTMFKKSVEAYEKDNSQEKSLAKQLFPSSSPNPVRDASQQRAIHLDGAPRLRSPVSILKPLAPSAMNKSYDRSQPPTNCGVKRTAGGLAKAISGASQDSFSDTTLGAKSLGGRNVDGDTSQNSKKFPCQDSVCFDENDFDSDIDIDLEVEDPNTKGSITYPALPSKKTDTGKSVSYPSLLQKAQIHTQSPRNAAFDTAPVSYEEPPHSSVPIPWSSSPIEHKAPPPNSQIFQQFAYAGPDTQGRAAPDSASDQIQRPTKRRTLPWLGKQSESADGATSHRASVATSAISRTSTAPHFTPLSKNTQGAPYPWNTTASAIKEQQKQLRKANKKPVQTGDVADDLAGPAIRAKKPANVSRPGLSREQRHVLDLVVESGKSVFFTGSAGTGKSVLLREIIAVLRKKYAKEQDRVAMTASTGLAACNIGGVTLHSFAGIGLGKEEVPELVKKIKRNQKAKHRWMRTKILVVDEISMVDGELFDKLEQIARQVRNNSRPFGGIQLVITGDFFQLPPVPDGGRAARFAFDASTWTTVIDHTIGLHHVFRQKDSAFADMLNEMREGRLSTASISAFKKLSRPLETHDDIAATELFPTRNEVDAANTARMRMLKGNVVRYDARDGGTIVDKAQRDRLLANCMAPEVLELKKGSQVMLIKNIDEMLVNGSLGKVYGFMSESQFDSYNADPDDFETIQTADDEQLNQQQLKKKRAISIAASTSQAWPLVRFTMPDGTTRDLLCNREAWKIELPNGEVQASRNQVPLILAWALSIHKAQGQTLERVKVDLGKVFERGQAYVALSRATSMAGLQVLRFEPGKVMAHEKVRTFYAGLMGVEGGGGRDEEFDSLIH